MKAYKIFQRKGEFGVHKYFSFAPLPSNLKIEYIPNTWIEKKVGGIFVFKDYSSVFDFATGEGYLINYHKSLVIYNHIYLSGLVSIWEVETEGLKDAPQKILAPFESAERDFQNFWDEEFNNKNARINSHINAYSKNTPKGSLICDKIKMVKELKIVT